MFSGIGNVNDTLRVVPPEERRATAPEPSAERRDTDVVELGTGMPAPAVYAPETTGRWNGGGGSVELPDELKALLAAASGSAGSVAQEGARLIAEVLDRVAANREQDVERVRAAVEEWRVREAKGEAGSQELIRLLREALGTPADLVSGA